MGPLKLGENMRKTGALCFLILLGLIAAAVPGWSQQVLSPPAKAACKFADGKTINVAYSSPRMRGRKIFGDLVPYGEVWRTGADQATSFVTNTDVVVGGKNVPAGSYTLFTLPTQNKWTLIISKQTGEFGIPYPGEQSDFARIDMKLSKDPSPVENFTISFEQGGTTCTMKVDWETTRASVDISEKK
jgi:Protein of unknown function (DUF2911)